MNEHFDGIMPENVYNSSWTVYTRRFQPGKVAESRVAWKRKA